jgi:TolB protein
MKDHKSVAYQRTRLIALCAICLLLAACRENTVEPVLSGAIQGRVLTAANSLPVGGVLITTNPPTESVITEADGSFSFAELAEGTYVISAAREGYEKAHVSVTVRGLQTVQAVIMLSVEEQTSVVAPPKIIRPADNALESNRSVELVWSRASTNPRDSLYYAVTLFGGSSPVPVYEVTGLRDTSLTVDGLRYGTSYFWQVFVTNGEGGSANSDVWSFRIADIPDHRIVYSANVDGNPEIYSTDTSGSSPIRLTDDPARDLWPRWNRDRSSIAFISDREGAYHIYTMKRDGSNVRRITSLPVDSYQNHGKGFCWSPDGGWIYYGHYDKLYRVNQFGANMALIATAPEGRHFREVEWSQQADRLVVHYMGAHPYSSEIALLRPDGSLEKELLGDVPGSLGSPSFSIDGGAVMYTRDRSSYEAPDGRQLNAHIQTLTLDQRDTVDVSHSKMDGTNDLEPRFSPDGAWIIFTNAPNDNSRQGSLWLMRHDGSSRRMIVSAGSQSDWR